MLLLPYQVDYLYHCIVSTFSNDVFFSAYEEFLSSLVKQEMGRMPRGIYHNALRGGAIRSDQGKTIAGIPSFMLKMYEKNKQPGLKPGLAGDAFLCLGI